MGIWKWSYAGIFVGGMVVATKGVEALKSKAAHKAYVNATAFGLRCRDEVMESITSVREGCEDIYAEAVELNEEYKPILLKKIVTKPLMLDSTKGF